MIERYSRKVMRDVWTEQNKFSAYLEVEILSCEAWSELGVIPREDVDKIRAAATFDVDRIKEIEEITRHDVVAFTRAVSESLGPERKWVHYGLTSTDVVDTANGYLLKQADEILLKDLEAFQEVLKRRALEFKDTPCIGRTHGIHADITSFGLKWALWHEEMKRNIERFQYARKGVEAGKMSGAVGNFANIPPFIQDYVCDKLGIASAYISTQVLQRDRHAYYLATLSVIASTLEQMAFEVRNLQRTEVREVAIDRKRLLGVGITVPGLLTADHARLLVAPTLGLRDVPLDGLIRSIPYQVHVENDGSASGHAEYFVRGRKGSMAR